MLELSTISIDPMGYRYGASKLFQVFAPLTAVILFQELLCKPLVGKISSQITSRQGVLNPEIERLLGFMTWKIGCDLGYFLMVSGGSSWNRAFTWSGIIPYTIAQYIVYYLFGRCLVIEGRLPFLPSASGTKLLHRPSQRQRFIAKYLHEDMNVTNENVPMRQVLLKPVVDYVGLVVSWSIYNMGMFYVQSGEINFDPLLHYNFYNMLTFYLVNTYGYILGFNLFELLYLRWLELDERWAQWVTQSLKLQKQRLAEMKRPIAALILQRWQDWEDMWAGIVSVWKYQINVKFQGFRQQYGLTPRWLISAIGGVICVTLVAPGVGNLMLSLGSQVSDIYFHQFVQMDQGQLAQVLTPATDASLPDPQLIVTTFPQYWQALYLDESQSSTLISRGMINE